MMANEGMNFRLTLNPFTVIGDVGGSVRMSMAQGKEINSRDDFDALIESIERLRDEVCMLNGYKGEWNIRWNPAPEDIPCAEG